MKPTISYLDLRRLAVHWVADPDRLGHTMARTDSVAYVRVCMLGERERHLKVLLSRHMAAKAARKPCGLSVAPRYREVPPPLPGGVLGGVLGALAVFGD